MRALLVIDYTIDFVATDGKLTCGVPGQMIHDRVVDITHHFLKNGDYVVMAVDVHDEKDLYHPETNLFPPHNIRGTKGRELYGDLQKVYTAHKQEIVWMDKTRYSAFAGTDLELRLRERGITEVHLIGTCTDICVLHTAVDCYNKNFRIVVYEDAVASFNPVGHDWALSHFKHTLGATVVKGVEGGIII